MLLTPFYHHECFEIPIPGHALHERGLQRHIGDDTLVSSQQRRALAISLINRLSTADEPVVNRGFCSFVGFKYELDCSRFRRDVQDSYLRYPGLHERQIFPGRTEPSTFLPARPCSAPPRLAPTGPRYVQVFDSAGLATKVDLCVRGHELTTVYWLAAHERA